MVLLLLGSCFLLVSSLALPSNFLRNEPVDDFAIPPILHGGFFGPEYKENLICELICIYFVRKFII